MIHDFETQLQVVLRALQEVVAPALADAEKHVGEQLMLSIATLSFVQVRLPEARRYARAEFQSYIDLANAAAGIAQATLPDAASDLRAEAALGAEALTDAEADIATYVSATRRLREGVTRLSHLCVGTACDSELDKLILDASYAMGLQSRLWCAPFGFELKPEDLPAPAWR